MENSMLKQQNTKREQNTKKFALQITAVLLAVSLMASICVFFGVRSSAASYSARTSAPSKSNTYYTTKNVFYNSGYGMPNCTCYAWGRAYEVLKSKPKLSTSSAGKWYSYNKSKGYYKYGSKPKLGAICCWSGHVAVVEKISGSTVTISESHSSGKNFDTTKLTVGKEKNYCSSQSFYGYIYVLNTSSSSTSSSSKTTKTTKTGTYKTNTGSDWLNLRKSASTSSSIIGIIPNGTKLKVTSVSGSWGKTTYKGKTGWVALQYCKKV